MQGPTPASMVVGWTSRTPLTSIGIVHAELPVITRGIHSKNPDNVILLAGRNPQQNPAAPSPGWLCGRDNVVAKAGLTGDGLSG